MSPQIEKAYPAGVILTGYKSEISPIEFPVNAPLDIR